MAGVYTSTRALAAAVSKETGVSAADVRKVLRASFNSTRAYVIQEAERLEKKQQLAKRLIGSIQV